MLAVMDGAGDLRVRLAAFEWLSEQVEAHGDVLARSMLAQGLVFDGQRVPLLGPQGIFKPRVCAYPLSITTIPDGPYADRMEGPYLRYSYRGTDPRHPDNVGLREAMSGRVPLVLFVRVAPGRYLAHHPVFIVGDDPEQLLFEVDVEARLGAPAEAVAPAAREAIERRYVTANFRRRVHQRAFRERGPKPFPRPTPPAPCGSAGSRSASVLTGAAPGSPGIVGRAGGATARPRRSTRLGARTPVLFRTFALQ
jgi:putative restriction endonuclease